MKTTKPASWITDMEPSPDWVIQSHREDESGWIIEARWWGWGEPTMTAGPSAVVIRPAEDAPADVRQRGVTSGVMRRLEPLLGEMVAELTAKPEAAEQERKAQEALAAWVRDALPEGGPRSSGDYYDALLHIFEELERTRPAPINDLARAMGVSKNTVKTRLRAARQRHGKEG